MSKAIKCTLIVNSANGRCFQPEEFNSIAEAYRKGRASIGFAFRIFAGGKIVKRGFCKEV